MKQRPKHPNRAAEKQASRDQDMRDLASSKKTAAELHDENKAFRLSGAKIDFSKSRSKLW